MDALSEFEAGLRRRRRIVIGVVVVLCAGAATVMAYSMRTIAKEAAKPDIEVRDVSELSEAERADIERQTGLRLPPKPVAFQCPAGMVAVAGAFCLDDRNVTNGEFLKCVDAGACPEFPVGPMCPPMRDQPRDEDVTCIEYAPSAAYCQWVGRRYTDSDEYEQAVRQLGDVQLRCAASSN